MIAAGIGVGSAVAEVGASDGYRDDMLANASHLKRTRMRLRGASSVVAAEDGASDDERDL